MPEHPGGADVPAGGRVSLAAKSPYELRVHLGDHVPESDVILEQDFSWLATQCRGTWYWRERETP